MDGSDKQAECECVLKWCHVIIEFVFRESGTPAGARAILEDGIRRAYKRLDAKGLEEVSRDLHEMAEALPVKEKEDLDGALHRQTNRGLDYEWDLGAL